MVLSIKRVMSIDDINDNFDCGVDYLNKNLKDDYYAHLCNQDYIRVCRINNEIVGYCNISIKELEMQYNDKVSDEGYDGDIKKSFGIVFLRYIMVHIDKQHKGIGREFLAQIITTIKTMRQFLPIRFIVIDALKERVEWYEKIGFKKINNDYNPKMYYDMITEVERKELIEYNKSYGG